MPYTVCMFFRAHGAVAIVIGAAMTLLIVAFLVFFAFTSIQQGREGTDSSSSSTNLSPEEKQAILAQLQGTSSLSVSQKQDILKKINAGSSNALTAEEKANIFKGLSGH